MTALGRPVTPNGDATSPRKQSAVLGTLIVVVLRAKNLTNRVRIGKQNPYCTVTYGLNKKRTETIERGGQQPTWDSEFRFELLRDERDQLGGDGANALVNKHGGVMPMAAASEQAKLQAAQASASTTSSNGKRVLKLACYADDVKDPKLVGEGVLELEETIKKGAFDDWVKLERKGRYAGEIYLELTWYSSDPPPERPPQRQEPLGAYGGPGSRTDDFSDDDRSNTEEWDGSEVGPSPGALDVAADYPDPDLAPLSHSMSTLSVNQRPPLPAPPPASNYQRQPSYGYGAPPPQNGGYQQPLDRRASYAGGPGGSYGAPAPNYGGAANEFGGYDGGQHGGDNQATIGASTQGRVSGFQQLANQHYASQGYRSNSYDQPPQQYQQPPQQQYTQPPPPPQIYESPPLQQGYSHPSQPSYQLPPQPPQPPATPSHWQQQQQQQPSNPLPQPPRPHSSASHCDYNSINGGSHLRHSPSVSSFAPLPSFNGPSSFQQPTPPNDYNQPQSHFAPPPSFAPPPQASSFGHFPPPPQPPQPPPSRYSTGTPLPIPPAPPSSASFYSAAPPQPPIPPPSLQQGGYHHQQQPVYDQFDHGAEPQDYNYPPPPQQQGGGGYYAPAPPPPPPSMQQQQHQQGGYGAPLPQPPGQQGVGAGSYNPYSGQQQW